MILGRTRFQLEKGGERIIQRRCRLGVLYGPVRKRVEKDEKDMGLRLERDRWTNDRGLMDE